jgi:hypothetical protein
MKASPDCAEQHVMTPKARTFIKDSREENSAVSQEQESRHYSHGSFKQALYGWASLPNLSTQQAHSDTWVMPPPQPETQVLPKPARTPYQFFQLGVNKEQVSLSTPSCALLMIQLEGIG